MNIRTLRNVIIGLFLTLVVWMGTASPLAKREPAVAVLFAGATFLTASWAVAPRTAKMYAITADSALKLDKILTTALVALKRVILPLRAFSVVFKDVPLNGTDIVQVPFIPLEAAASTDFDQDDGYITGDGSVNARPVTINKRKYQALGITGRQLAREPVLEIEKILVKKAEKLGEDVIADIFSAVTLANFGAAVFTGAASAFDSDDITDIRTACADAMWPEMGRSLVLNTSYDGHLMKDSAIKNALNFGGSEAIREGRIPQILGFGYHAAPVLPGNSENLVGFAALESAVLAAFAPIAPPPSTRALMTDYRSVSDEETGLTIEFRNFGNPQGDEDSYIIEVNYGYGKGDAAQLKRLVSA